MTLLLDSPPTASEEPEKAPSYSYGAFGEGQTNRTTGYSGRLGGYSDDKAGVLNWRRWYLPSAGRWASRDTVGISGGPNLFRYAGNNVPYFVDPAGTYPDHLVKTYGNWVGPDWSGGWRPSEHGGQDGPHAPIDDLDALAQVHDHEYAMYGFTSNTPNSHCKLIANLCLRDLCKLKARVDRKLIQGVRGLSANPANWHRHPENGSIPSDWFAKTYKAELPSLFPKPDNESDF